MGVASAYRRRRTARAGAEPYEAGLHAGRRRTRRWFVVISVVLLAAAAGIGYGVSVAVSGRHAHRSAAPTVASSPPASVTTPSAPTQGSSGGLTLEKPARTVDGVGQGWSDTQLGAISAAVTYTEAIGSTPDEGRVDTILSLVVVPSNVASSIQDMASRYANESQTAQEESATTTVLDYQLASCSTTQCGVWMLGTVILTLDNGQVQTQTLDGGLIVVWSGGDWKLENSSAQPPGSGPPSSDPGTSAAVAKGWKPIGV